MKKSFLIIVAIVLCFSCDDKDKIINPVLLADEETIVAFFEKHLPTPSLSTSECFFVGDENDGCIMINSMDELIKNMVCSSIVPPEIDFNLYTLIVGQHQMPNSYYYIVEQNIVESGRSRLILNLRVKLPDDGHWPAFSKLYYWGIYPKLENKTINVNLIKER